jgi:hypothetical protein
MREDPLVIAIAPRLLSTEQARAYLGGCNPAKLVAPTRVGGRVRWDRQALDAALDRLAGIVRPSWRATEDELDAELETWRREMDAKEAQAERDCRSAFQDAAGRVTGERIDAALAGRQSLSIIEAATAMGVKAADVDTALRIGLLPRSSKGGAARFSKDGLMKALRSKP